MNTFYSIENYLLFHQSGADQQPANRTRVEGGAAVAGDGSRGRKEQVASEGGRAGRCDATVEVREGGKRKASADQLAA